MTKVLRNLTVDDVNQVLFTKNIHKEVDNESYVILDLSKNKHLIDPKEFISNIDDVKYCISMKYSDFRRVMKKLVEAWAQVDSDVGELVENEQHDDTNGRRGPLSS